MSGVVPYLIRAYCDWIEDSGLTPHVLVNCEKNGTLVPEGLAKEGKIVLNISSSATVGRAITNDSISFKARFNGKSQQVIVYCAPMVFNAVLLSSKGYSADVRITVSGRFSNGSSDINLVCFALARQKPC